MNATVEGRNSADAYSPLDGGAGILLLGLEGVVWAGVSTVSFCLFFLFCLIFLVSSFRDPRPGTNCLPFPWHGLLGGYRSNVSVFITSHQYKDHVALYECTGVQKTFLSKEFSVFTCTGNILEGRKKRPSDRYSYKLFKKTAESEIRRLKKRLIWVSKTSVNIYAIHPKPRLVRFEIPPCILRTAPTT